MGISDKRRRRNRISAVQRIVSRTHHLTIGQGYRAVVLCDVQTCIKTRSVTVCDIVIDTRTQTVFIGIFAAVA